MKQYEEYEIEIVDHRDVKSIELLRVSSWGVAEQVLQQRLKEFPMPPKLIMIRRIKDEAIDTDLRHHYNGGQQ